MVLPSALTRATAVRLAGRRFMSAKSKAHVAVVGCGGWTQGWHLPNLANRSDASIVAVVDPNETPGEKGCVPSLCEPMPDVASKYGARWYKSLEELLADKDALALDGVLCAAPHGMHERVGTAVLEAGLHLLMEKPLTADVAEAQALFALSQARPTQAFLLNNTANWQPGTIAAFEACQAGKLGSIRHVNAVFAAPLEWLFGGDTWWAKPSGTMIGNGFGWGQLSHTFAWLFKVTDTAPMRALALSPHPNCSRVIVTIAWLEAPTPWTPGSYRSPAVSTLIWQPQPQPLALLPQLTVSRLHTAP